jgi:multimeric flavodoxin WrbA
MQIMTILGSPRRQGNTAKVLEWVEDQLRAGGHQVDAANMLDYEVQGCGECLACKRGTVELCSIDDDANALFRRMVTADLVLIAAPVFCWGFPAQIKGMIDRMFCMMDFDGERPGAPRLHNKPMALLLTGGREEADNADMVVRGFRHLVEYLKGRMLGHLFISDCTTPEKIGGDVKNRAVEFATMLGDQTCWARSPS